MRKGLVFTLMNMYYLVLLLTIYVAAVVIPQMPSTSSYFRARNNAAEYWWLSEFNNSSAVFPASGACVEVPQIFPYNETTGMTSYDDLNVVAPIVRQRRCG